MPGADPQRADLDLLLSAMAAAAEVAMRFHGKSPRHWHKPDGSVVTEGDLAVDAELKRIILAARPGDGWLSEETPDSAERLSRERLWIFDPIDGTRAYLSGGENWCIGGALVIGGRLAVSAVLLPVAQTLFHAVHNGGSFRNGEPFSLPAASVGTGVIAPKQHAPQLAKAGLLALSGQGLPLLLRLTAVAEGKLSGAVSTGHKHDWDIAAGHLILEEAGGRISTLSGSEMIYNCPKPWQPGMVAAAPLWHQPILDCMRNT